MSEGAGLWAVVGAGPGSREFLVPAAVEAVEASEMVLGAPRLLNLFDCRGKEVFRLGKDRQELAALLRQNLGRRVAIVVSGDPGFFSLLQWLRREFPDQKIRVVPGISSVQMAFARLATSWHDAVFVSLHGRGWEELDPYLPLIAAGAKCAVLTGGAACPARLASYLLDKGIANRRVWVGAFLGTSDEKVLETDLEGLAREADFPDSAVLVMGYE